MSEETILVRVPAPLLQYGLQKDEIERRVREWLVFSLFTEGRVSSGKAAQLLEIPRLEFLDLLHQRGIAYFDYSPEEMSEELAAADSLVTQSKE
jgi:predicted HTH domain antitoxin